MSIKVMEWVWSYSRARNGALLVLLAIADNASHDGGNAWPSNAELCRKSRLSSRGVQAAVKGLQELGELEVAYQTGPGGCNRYRVLMIPAVSAPPLSIPAPPQDLHPRSIEHEGAQESTEAMSETAPVTVLEPTTNRPKDISSEIAEAIPDPVRADVERLCEHLADRITLNGSKRPTITKGWRTAARLLLDKDGCTEDQVNRAIVWCQNDEFWRTNILSMPKLRDKYDQLRLAAKRSAVPKPRNDIDWTGAMDRAASREADGGSR